jgi:hypothetical protein
LEFSRNPGKDHAVKNRAEALQAEAVRYKLSLGWEVKTEIPVEMEPQIADFLERATDAYPWAYQLLG